MPIVTSPGTSLVRAPSRSLVNPGIYLYGAHEIPGTAGPWGKRGPSVHINWKYTAKYAGRYIANKLLYTTGGNLVLTMGAYAGGFAVGSLIGRGLVKVSMRRRRAAAARRAAFARNRQQRSRPKPAGGITRMPPQLSKAQRQQIARKRHRGAHGRFA